MMEFGECNRTVFAFIQRRSRLGFLDLVTILLLKDILFLAFAIDSSDVLLLLQTCLDLRMTLSSSAATNPFSGSMSSGYCHPLQLPH